MRVGVPRELKNNEFRVAITQAGVTELVAHGHEVFVERGAGEGSSIPDRDYLDAGATILPTADDVWATGDLILKVKEPIAEEYHRMRRARCSSLSAPGGLTAVHRRPLASGITAIAYETVELPDGSLPLLAPMSEVAGRLAPQVGPTRSCGPMADVECCWGVSGVHAGKVVVLGAGVSGSNAAAIALGMQAEVLVLDRNIARLRHLDAIYQGHLQTVASNTYEVTRCLLDADLVIGAVLVPGAKAPRW